MKHNPDNNDHSTSLSVSRDFLRTMSSRRSIRSFSSEAVDRELVLNAVRTANTAPSGANMQPWYFAVIESATIKTALRAEAERVEWEFYNEKAPDQWLEDLRPLGTNHLKPYLTEAPYLIAIFTRNFRQGDSERSYYPMESTGLATGLLLASLHQAGLATLTHTPRPMSFLNKLLDLDATYRPYMLVVTGKAAADAQLPELTRKTWDEVSGIY